MLGEAYSRIKHTAIAHLEMTLKIQSLKNIHVLTDAETEREKMREGVVGR